MRTSSLVSVVKVLETRDSVIMVIVAKVLKAPDLVIIPKVVKKSIW